MLGSAMGAIQQAQQAKIQADIAAADAKKKKFGTGAGAGVEIEMADKKPKPGPKQDLCAMETKSVWRKIPGADKVIDAGGSLD